MSDQSAGAPPSMDVPFVAAVSVFVFRGDRLLAMQRSVRKDAAPGAWEAVSGRVQAGEDPHAAAVRECREETGLEVAIDPTPVAAYTAKRLGADMLVVLYRGVTKAGDFVLSDEHDAAAWMTLDEFARVCPFPRLVETARLAAARAAVDGAPTGGAASGSAAPHPAPAIAFVRLWAFRPRAGKEREFESAYGPDGDWARLFRTDREFLGTELLHDGEGRYVTVDRWTSRAAWEAFHARERAAYVALDRRCAGLTASEDDLGSYTTLP